MKDCVSCVHEYLSPMSDTCRECGIAMLNYKEAKPNPATNAETSDGEWHEIIHVPPHDGEAFEKVISERISQTEKWGNNPCNHPFEWMSILGEEYGELCEAVNETCFMNGKHPERGGAENIVREAAQIAAVAIAIIRDFSPAILPAEEGE